MKKIKKALMTIIWSIVAFFVVGVISESLFDGFRWVIPSICALLVLVLSIKGKLPGTDIEKIIVPKRKKTPWYLWKFSFASMFILYIFGFTTYSMLKDMEWDIIIILMDILLFLIFILCVNSICLGDCICYSCFCRTWCDHIYSN